jgi:ankyrin repeat protein
VAAAQLLVDAGASTTALSKTGLTPLVAAACSGNTAVVAMLLKERFDEGHGDVEDALIAAGRRMIKEAQCPGGTGSSDGSSSKADEVPQSSSSDGKHGSAADTAAVGDRAKTDGSSSSSAADDAADSNGGSADAAGVASSSRSKSSFRLVEEQSASGKSETLPLHRAVAYGHKQVVELLLAVNADPNLRCCHGYSPLLQVRAAVQHLASWCKNVTYMLGDEAMDAINAFLQALVEHADGFDYAFLVILQQPLLQSIADAPCQYLFASCAAALACG